MMDREVKILAYYPYRKGYVRGEGVIHFPRDLMRDFEHALAELAGVKQITIRVI